MKSNCVLMKLNRFLMNPNCVLIKSNRVFPQKISVLLKSKAELAKFNCVEISIS